MEQRTYNREGGLSTPKVQPSSWIFHAWRPLKLPQGTCASASARFLAGLKPWTHTKIRTQAKSKVSCMFMKPWSLWQLHCTIHGVESEDSGVTHTKKQATLRNALPWVNSSHFEPSISDKSSLAIWKLQWWATNVKCHGKCRQNRAEVKICFCI